MEIITRSYHPAQDAVYGDANIRPLQNHPTYADPDYWSLSVQPFRAGGYEATIKKVNLQKSVDVAALPRHYGSRVAGDEVNQESLESARQRAKGMVRKRVKDMGGNRLCTLTIRQSDDLGYFSPEHWADSFSRFRRMLRKAGLMNDYVAVLEPHKKGLERLRERSQGYTQPDSLREWDIPLHLHFVTRSDFKLPINLMRKCWRLASGRDGNVDVQWLKPGRGRDSIDKVASYVSKYITKGLAEFERFNKKRYWSAGPPLLKKGLTWLQARTLSDCLPELRLRLGLDFDRLQSLSDSRCLFFFPDGRGAWLNVRPIPEGDLVPF